MGFIQCCSSTIFLYFPSGDDFIRRAYYGGPFDPVAACARTMNPASEYFINHYNHHLYCRCFMLLTSVASFFASFGLWALVNKQSEPIPYEAPPLQFELRQVHAVSPDTAHVLFSDVSPKALSSLAALCDPTSSTKSVYGVRPRMAKIHRPSSAAAHAQARLRSLRYGENEWLQWEEDEILSPDVESRATLLELAKMTNNAYLEPTDDDWYDLDGKWNVVRNHCSTWC